MNERNVSGCVCETENGQIVELCCAHDEYFQSKLTKLREALDEYDPDNDDPDYPTQWDRAYRNFYQVVKELLEQEEK